MMITVLVVTVFVIIFALSERARKRGLSFRFHNAPKEFRNSRSFRGSKSMAEDAKSRNMKRIR